MIGGACPPMRVKWSQRWSPASRRRSVATRSPVVELLPHLEVEKGLGRDDAVERPHPVRELEELGAAGGDDLDDDVELAGGDDDVVGLGPARDLVRDRARRPRRLDPDDRLLEAEAERIRDGDDLEDPLGREARVTGADGRFRDPDARGDRAERLAPADLERLDDLPVEVVDPPRRRDGSPFRSFTREPNGHLVLAAHRAGFLPPRCAFRQCDARASARFSGPPGFSTAGPCPTQRSDGSSPVSARADSRFFPSSHVAIAASGNGSGKPFETANRPYEVKTSPAMRLRSRVSRKATCPGVCPGAATTSRLPTRSPGRRRTPGSVFSVGHEPGSFPSTTCSPAWIRASSSGMCTSTWSPSRSRSSSREPTWSPCPCVSAIRAIVPPAAAAASIRSLAPRGSVVSTSVKPPSSRTRYALTNRARVSWTRFSVS